MSDLATPTRPVTAAAVWRTGLVATAVAIAVNIVLWLVAAAAGVDLVVPDFRGEGTLELPVWAVVLWSVVGGLLATVAARVISRIAAAPPATLPGLIVVGLLVSLVPLTQVTSGVVVLGLMHVVVATSMLLAFRRR